MNWFGFSMVTLVAARNMAGRGKAIEIATEIWKMVPVSPGER